MPLAFMQEDFLVSIFCNGDIFKPISYHILLQGSYRVLLKSTCAFLCFFVPVFF